MKRRKFLETLTAATAAGAAIEPSLFAQDKGRDENPPAARANPAGKKIRLGLVRADTHGYYYGMMLEDSDPLLLAKNNYVVHHYASNIYDPSKLTVPRVPGFEITKVYDYKPENAAAFSETFRGKPLVCRSLEETAEGIDAVFIADCDGGGGDHLELAAPFLKKRIPAFVDKPFAFPLADALEIVRLAKDNRTPLFNASILTYVPAADHFKSRFQEILHAYWPVPAEVPAQPLSLGVVKGVGGAFSQELMGKAVQGGIEKRLAYIIHGIALGLNLFGKGVEWVEAMGRLPLEYLHIHLLNGIDVVVLNAAIDVFPESCSFYASAYSKFGAVHSNPIGDPEFLGGAEKILGLFKEMVLTGKPPADYDDFIEPIAVVKAGQIAQNKGSRVLIKDVWNRTG